MHICRYTLSFLSVHIIWALLITYFFGFMKPGLVLTIQFFKVSHRCAYIKQNISNQTVWYNSTDGGSLKEQHCYLFNYKMSSYNNINFPNEAVLLLAISCKNTSVWFQMQLNHFQYCRTVALSLDNVSYQDINAHFYFVLHN